MTCHVFCCVAVAGEVREQLAVGNDVNNLIGDDEDTVDMFNTYVKGLEVSCSVIFCRAVLLCASSNIAGVRACCCSGKLDASSVLPSPCQWTHSNAGGGVVCCSSLAVFCCYAWYVQDRAAGKKPARGVLKTPARAAAEPEDEIEDDDQLATAVAAAAGKGSKKRPRGSRIKFAADVELSPDGEAAATGAAAQKPPRGLQQQQGGSSRKRAKRHQQEEDDGWDCDEQQQQSDSSGGWHSKRSGSAAAVPAQDKRQQQQRGRQQPQQEEAQEQFISEEDEEPTQQHSQHKSPTGEELHLLWVCGMTYFPSSAVASCQVG